jgi:hypothetical protein
MKKLLMALALSTLFLSSCSSVSAEAFDLVSIKIDDEQVLSEKLNVPVDIGVTDGGEHRVQIGIETTQNNKTWKLISDVKTLTVPISTELSVSWIKKGQNTIRVSVWPEGEDLKGSPLASSEVLVVEVFDLSDIYRTIGDPFWAYSDAEDSFYDAIDTCYTLDGQKGNSSTFRNCFDDVKAARKVLHAKGESYIEAINGLATISKLSNLFNTYSSFFSDSLGEQRYILDNFCTSYAKNYGNEDDLEVCVNTLNNKAVDSYDRDRAAWDKSNEIYGQISEFLDEYGYPPFTEEPDIQS